MALLLSFASGLALTSHSAPLRGAISTPRRHLPLHFHSTRAHRGLLSGGTRARRRLCHGRAA
eukprot:4296252-Pleurochrysis_carterae.AAC.4